MFSWLIDCYPAWENIAKVPYALSLKQGGVRHMHPIVILPNTSWI